MGCEDWRIGGLAGDCTGISPRSKAEPRSGYGVWGGG